MPKATEPKRSALFISRATPEDNHFVRWLGANDRSPVTIRFADAIGDVLVAAPQSKEPMLPFKFYI
ncbi:hypothetical protein [Paucibacter soli]|uniref:hypothetical protein n=1 Tax=Paucibacter soli TaxID=3133433 RepID=UPI00309E64B7